MDPMRAAWLTLLFAALALGIGGLVIPEPTPTAIVAYYQGIKDPRITLCVDTFGRVTMYEASLRKAEMLTPQKFSICLESEKEIKDLARAFDEVGVDYGFGAVRR